MVLNKAALDCGFDARVRRLIDEYRIAAGSPAYLLCDRHDPDAPALRFVRRDLSLQTVSYGELAHRSRALADELVGLGVRPGDRVGTLMGKSVELVVALLAIWRTGAVHVPLFTAFGREAVTARLRAARAVGVIHDSAHSSKLDLACLGAEYRFLAVECAGEPGDRERRFRVGESGDRTRPRRPPCPRTDELFEIFTSGTTGKPKGVVVPQRALATFVAYETFGLDLREDDVFWNAADPGWAYGLWYAVTAPLALGRTFVLTEGTFDPDHTWQVLAKLRVTNFSAAPTIYRSLRVSARPANTELALRCAASAGEPLTPEVNTWAANALGLQVRDHYGQTELGMVINNHAHPGLMRPIRAGSMGHPMPGWSVQILHPEADEIAPRDMLGRVAVDVQNSPLMWFRGYSRDPHATAARYAGAGRWFLTGDSAAMDEEGYVHFSARADDVIIMAGYRIGPVDLESILADHPAVAECAVVAAPDQMRGEVVEAFVVLRAGHHQTEALVEELQQLVRQRYGAHAYPRRVHFETTLPKTPSGKIQRNVLRDRRREAMENAAASASA